MRTGSRWRTSGLLLLAALASGCGGLAAPIKVQPIRFVLVDGTPAWSPDGQWIAWSKAGTIWLMKPDGTEARALIYGDEPSWSPDSRRIAFSQVTFNVVRLYAIDPATLRIHQITR